MGLVMATEEALRIVAANLDDVDEMLNEHHDFGKELQNHIEDKVRRYGICIDSIELHKTIDKHNTGLHPTLGRFSAFRGACSLESQRNENSSYVEFGETPSRNGKSSGIPIPISERYAAGFSWRDPKHARTWSVCGVPLG